MYFLGDPHTISRPVWDELLMVYGTFTHGLYSYVATFYKLWTCLATT